MEEKQQRYPVISTPVGTVEGKIIFAYVVFDGDITKELVSSLILYLTHLENLLDVATKYGEATSEIQKVKETN